MTLQDLTERWLAMKAPRLAPKSQSNYRYLAEIAIGHCGAVRLDRLTVEHMNGLLNYMQAAKFKNIGGVFGVLGQMFKYARSSSLRWMLQDPLDGLELSPTKRRQNQTLTEAQRAALLAVAATEHDLDVPLLPLWHLYSRLGLRKGEGIALLWSDIDWDAKTLTIDESITNVGPDNVRGTTKGKAVRVVPLPDDLIALLREHQAQQRRRGIFPSVFVDARGETVTPQHVQYRWALLRVAAGCPNTTIHDLRHTALTLLALAGAPQSVRMALAGHRSEQMAWLYSNHASVEDMRRFVG